MPVRRPIVIYWASEVANDDFISRQDGDGGRPDAGGADVRQFDVVSASNLNRQFFFRDQIGRKKVAALGENLQRIEPELDLELCDIRLNSESVRKLFSSPGENIILNGTFTLANENYVVVYFRCSLGLTPPVQAG